MTARHVPCSIGRSNKAHNSVDEASLVKAIGSAQMQCIELKKEKGNAEPERLICARAWMDGRGDQSLTCNGRHPSQIAGLEWTM